VNCPICPGLCAYQRRCPSFAVVHKSSTGGKSRHSRSDIAGVFKEVALLSTTPMEGVWHANGPGKQLGRCPVAFFAFGSLRSRNSNPGMERAMGFEPTTTSLGS
jgi:hypothetical protein